MSTRAFGRSDARALALALTPLVASCALVAGGLDEGRSRAADDPSDAGAVAVTDAAPEIARCPGWLAGFRRRAPLLVRNTGAALGAHQQRVLVDTGTLASTGRLRPDATDLRFALRDATIALAHWIAGRASDTELEAWVRMDVPSGESSAWVYYDRPDAEDASSLEATFVRGVVDDPRFELGVWSAGIDDRGDAPARTNEWSLAFEGDGTARIRVFRQADPNGRLGRACATMIFPAGGRFAVDVDVDLAIADHGDAMVLVDDDGASGDARGKPGRYVRSASPIASGTHTVCIAAGAEGGPNGSGVDARFSRPRVRRWSVSTEASIALSREERCE